MTSILRKLERAVVRHPVRNAALTAVPVAVAVAALTLGGDGDTGGAGVTAPKPIVLDTRLPHPEVRSDVPATTGSEPPPASTPAPRFTLARVRPGARVALRSRPAGELVAVLGARTEFHSPRTLWVARRRGPWLGVPAPGLPNGRLGWIRRDSRSLELYGTDYSIRADLSARTIAVRYGRRVLERHPVTVGRSGSTTPTGDFSITDALEGDLGFAYGCCILALSGHQPSLPPGWVGGDRIAIHGTSGPLSAATSAGCLRASDRTMRRLFAQVPLGTPVFIRE